MEAWQISALEETGNSLLSMNIDDGDFSEE